MLYPVLHLMEKALINKGKCHLASYLPNYFGLRLPLGMVTRINDIWDPGAVAYDPLVVRLLSWWRL